MSTKLYATSINKTQLNWTKRIPTLHYKFPTPVDRTRGRLVSSLSLFYASGSRFSQNKRGGGPAGHYANLALCRTDCELIATSRSAESA